MAVLRIHTPVLGQDERVFDWDGRPITIGRDDTCDVVLLEQAASRHHARLERHGAEIRLIDCESANGVWVGSERVVGSRPLHDGDVVRIGDTTLTLALDPHRQPTIIREPKPAPESSAEPEPESATEPEPEPAAPVTRDDIGSGPTSAAIATPFSGSSSTEPALVSPPAASPPRAQPPVTTSSPSAYSLGSDPTVAGHSGPNLLGIPDRSSPSDYSIGEAATLAPNRGPSDVGRPLSSSASVYSLGHDPSPQDRGPQDRGPQDRGPRSSGVDRIASSAASVYSLGPGHEGSSRSPEPALGLQLAASSSVYSIGDAHGPAARGPDTPELPPAPTFEGVGSSAELGAPPAPPGPPLLPLLEPRAVRAPPLLPLPSPRSAASSWEWKDAPRQEGRRRRQSPQPTLWLGVGLLLGGVVAIVVALAFGFQPGSLLGSSSRYGGWG